MIGKIKDSDAYREAINEAQKCARFGSEKEKYAFFMGMASMRNLGCEIAYSVFEREDYEHRGKVLELLKLVYDELNEVLEEEN